MAVAEHVLRSARESVFADRSNVVRDELRLDEPRFFVQMGWGVLQVDTSAVPNRYFLRGEITPVSSHARKANIMDIREGEVIPGSEEIDPSSGRVVWGKYWCRAHYEAERLLEIEGNSTHKNGLVEIQALRGNANVYQKYDLNEIFYPNGLNSLPQSHEEMRKYLVARIGDLTTNPPEDIPDYILSIILNIGAELLGAVTLAAQIQHSRLQFTHSSMKLKPGEEGFKREYDAVDREMIVRTGMPEIHSAEISTAMALDKLTNRSQEGGDDLRSLVEILAQQAANQQKMLELLAEKAEKPTRAKKVNE